MIPIWKDLGHILICETATIEWLEPTPTRRRASVGLIRFLSNNPRLPYRGSVTVHIMGREYEFKGMVFRALNDAPTLAEHRAIKRYLANMGLIGLARRLKSNGLIVVKQYLGSIAHNLEIVKMAQVIVSLDYINDSGVKAANVTATYNELDYAGVVTIQGAVVNSLLELGEARSAEKQKAAV